MEVPAARLERDAIVELAIPPPGEALTLRVPLTVAAAPGAQATVRVLSGDGRRELVERLPVPPRPAPPGERVLLVPVPGGWLRPGVYRAALEIPDVAPTRFSFVALRR